MRQATQPSSAASPTWHVPVAYQDIKFSYVISIEFNEKRQKEKLAYTIADLYIKGIHYDKVVGLPKGNYGRPFLCYPSALGADATPLLIKILRPLFFIPDNFALYSSSLQPEGAENQKEYEHVQQQCIVQGVDAFYFLRRENVNQCRVRFLSSDPTKKPIDCSTALAPLLRTNRHGGPSKFMNWFNNVILPSDEEEGGTLDVPTKFALSLLSLLYKELKHPDTLISKTSTLTAFTEETDRESLHVEARIHETIGTRPFTSNIKGRGLEDVLEGLFFLLMRFWQRKLRQLPFMGRNLWEEIIENKDTMTALEFLSLLIAAAEPLAALIAKHKVIHCDVKPENLMVVQKAGRDDAPAIIPIDFGLSRNEGEASYQINSFCNYYAPETYRSSKTSRRDPLKKDLLRRLEREESARQRPDTGKPVLESLISWEVQALLISAIKSNKIQEASHTLPSRDIYAFGILIWRLYFALTKAHETNKDHWTFQSEPLIKALIVECCAIDPLERPTYEALIEKLLQLSVQLNPAAAADTCISPFTVSTPTATDTATIPTASRSSTPCVSFASFTLIEKKPAPQQQQPTPTQSSVAPVAPVAPAAGNDMTFWQNPRSPIDTPSPTLLPVTVSRAAAS